MNNLRMINFRIVGIQLSWSDFSLAGLGWAGHAYGRLAVGSYKKIK